MVFIFCFCLVFVLFCFVFCFVFVFRFCFCFVLFCFVFAFCFCLFWLLLLLFFLGGKYTSGPRYWNVPVLVNTGTFLVYQYCMKMWYLRSLERAGVIKKLKILEHKIGLVLSNTRVPVSGTWSILFPWNTKLV